MASRIRWTYPALAILTVSVAAAVGHQSEGWRLRQLEQETAARLKSDLERAFVFASALQNASPLRPRLSPGGDTVVFFLPQGGGRHVDQLRLFVDAERGGLWLERDHRPAQQVAHTVDAFHVAMDNRTDGRTVLWMELSARLSQSGEPPLRHHLYRSFVLAGAAGTGGQG